MKSQLKVPANERMYRIWLEGMTYEFVKEVFSAENNEWALNFILIENGNKNEAV